MESEKKLRALNFIRARIPIEFQDLPPDESASHNEFVDIDLNFSDIYSFDEIDNLDELDSSTVYFVAGYVSHSLIRRHKCECCKSHLSADSSFEDLGQDETRLFVEINRGGLSSPSDFCFTVCLLSYLYFKQLKSSEISMKRFLCYENQQNVFVENVIRRLSTFFGSQVNSVKYCSLGHSILRPMISSIFNCFAKNLKRQLNTRHSDEGTSRKLTKLTSNF